MRKRRTASGGMPPSRKASGITNGPSSCYGRSCSRPPGTPARARLAWCYRSWIVHVKETEKAPQKVVQRLARELRERCPDSVVLKEIEERFLGDFQETGLTAEEPIDAGT